MKNKIQKIMAALLVVATITGQINALGARRGSKKVVAKESPAMQVNKQVSVLDQIVEQARKIVEAMGPKAQATRATAKRELSQLMKDLKELDPQIHDVIKETIETIKGATVKNKAETKQAFDSLIAVINSMDAQANVISTIEEGRIAIELAPAEMKQEVISQQVQNVQAAEAQAEQAGLMSRMVGGIKSTLAKPGNYFFGEQRTAAKTAFEAAVGVAVVGGLSYLAYKLTPEGTGEGTLTKLQDLYSRGKKALGFEKEQNLTKEGTAVRIKRPLSPRQEYGKETLERLSQTETGKAALGAFGPETISKEDRKKMHYISDTAEPGEMNFNLTGLLNRKAQPTAIQAEVATTQAAVAEIQAEIAAEQTAIATTQAEVAKEQAATQMEQEEIAAEQENTAVTEEYVAKVEKSTADIEANIAKIEEANALIENINEMQNATEGTSIVNETQEPMTTETEEQTNTEETE